MGAPVGLFEKKKLGDKGRAAYTETVKGVVAAMLVAGDGHGWSTLHPDGQVKTGKELGKNPKDSAWWVGGGNRRKLDDDFGEFRKRLSKLCERYDVPDQARAHERGVLGKVVSVAGTVAGGVMVATGVAAGAGFAVMAGAQAAGRGIAELGGADADGKDVLGVLAAAGGAAAGVEVEAGDDDDQAEGQVGPGALRLDEPMARAMVAELVEFRQTGTLPDGEVRRLQRAKAAGVKVHVTSGARRVFAQFAASMAAGGS